MSAESAPVATEGCLVKVHYTGTLEDGTQFDSSEGRDPIGFAVGKGQMIPGFDAAVQGMAVGESKTVTLPPAEAYGELDPRAVLKVPLDQLPEGVKVGDKLQAGNGQRVVVTAIEGNEVTVDMNHHLAGKALTFTLRLEGCAPAPILVREVISDGDGRTFPKPGDKLQMHYTGTLADGTQFDSSVGKAPFEFTIGVGQVIQGWDQGVMQMSLGEKATLKIPSALGYGEQGAGGVIPPSADLVFTVELLGIE